MAPPVTPVKGGAPGAASPPRARAPRWANTTRWLRAHGDGVLLESSEPGLAPLLLTSNKAGVVAKVVQPVKSDGDLSPAGKRPKSPKKSPKFGFGKKKAKAPRRGARRGAGARRARGPAAAPTPTVGVLPVAPKSAKRLNSKQKADEKLCLRLLHRALSEQPWVYSTRSPAATHTAPRVCELADVAAAEAAAVVANDGALVDAGAARWCAVAGHVVVDAVDLGAGATAAGDAAVALIVTRTAVDHCGRRLSKRGLDAQCKAAATAETELLVATGDDAARRADGVALGDEAYARRQLLAAWRGHADALAVLRAGTAARWAPAAVGARGARSRPLAGGWAAAVRGLRAAIYDGSRQDGLDLVVGRKAPADAVAGADAATYAHERIDVAYLKVAAAVFAVAAALRSQAGDARPAAILQHALLAVLAAIVLTFYAAFADGSLATALASARRFDDH
ncbi:hypothetical protein SO694_00006416 [Aureococcus anophagefferens]|uniref:SAC domain-containing protein n=1 Tax=Aureococcus anophagefferens TaxID=44056 RepID=A0ABR1GA85_AURAN